MKKTLSMITLAVLSVGLLGSCSKINERLDNLEKKVNGIENEKIASIDSQIESINSSIADLGTIRTNIQNLTATTAAQAQDIKDLNNEDTEIGKKISDLKKADESINKRIDDLQKYVNDTLEAYGTKEWVDATFSTLAQYEETCDTIAKIDARIGALDSRLSQSIEDCADSLSTWVNEKFDGYYTIAQMDAKIAQMNAQLDTLCSTATDSADSLKAEIVAAKAELDTVKANIRTEYKAAIETAITELDGKLSNELQTKISQINSSISTLSSRVTTLETSVSNLTGRVEKLEAMIQSVTIIPAYNDGSVVAKDSILYLDIIVEPAGAVTSITKDKLTVLVNEVKTKVVSVDTVPVTKFTVDAAKGTITARADISSKLPMASGKALTAAVNVKNNLSDITTSFYPVVISTNVTTSTSTGGDSTKVNIKADPNFPGPVVGNIAVEDGFKDSTPTTIEVEGIGTITFDATAAEKIKENAGDATNILIKVEDITETLANPVPDADVVLEVTMKAVNEAGTDVFSEEKAAGTVTIEIPVDGEVVFVKNVTLVDDYGVVIENGVDPETIKLDLEKHLLSFEVKHFSKYAVGYVKKDAFVDVTEVSLDPTSATLPVGDSITLTATVAPDNATNTKVTWTSSNNAVATVDKNGKVKAVADGTATITVTTENGSKTATCTVTVVIGVTGVTLNKTELTLAVGGYDTLTATVNPTNATNKDKTWSSSNTNVATVGNDGKVTAVAHGTATITVTTGDGSKTATCTVKVTTGVGFEEYGDGGNI